ncbi:MAG: fumarylacetoacetate hydrolase family protein [Chloroflexota bacterium]|nr:fumarylacetoacetate hydrolase family protein [Chloroflexota bacterium]
MTRHRTDRGSRWALDGRYLPERLALSELLQYRVDRLPAVLESLPLFEEAREAPVAPVDPWQEVWASGVTYLRSRDAREAESAGSNVYNKVYEAERPELFLKAPGWRVVGPNAPVRIRPDSSWNVPEPELVLVLNRHMEIAGYTAGNDMSSREIEGENPLYLPQAKIYDRSCALGPRIVLTSTDELRDLPVQLNIEREGQAVFTGETSTGQMRRTFEELASYLGRDLGFPDGALLMTGTGIVPDETFTLVSGDVITVTAGELTLCNPVV